MTFLQKRKILWAHLFQMVIVFFILFSAYTETGSQLPVKTNSKTLLCIGSGSPVVLRESSEQLSPSLSFFKHHNLLEKIWLCVKRVHASELFTNVALRVSNRFYNNFYVIITIHAP